MEESISQGETPVRAQAQQLSSNHTIFWKVFFPIFTTVFLTGMLAVFCLIDEDDLYMSFPVVYIRVGLLLIWAAWILLMRRTLWRLKRVDRDETYIYVSNYWNTARYLQTDIDRVEEKRRLGKRIVNFHLKGSGIFGTKISFLPGSDYINGK